MVDNHITQLPGLIGDLFRTVDRLNMLFPDKPFTPDGHLVGSIGEVVAAYLYDLTLEKSSNEGFDARTSDKSRTVDIKLAGGDRVAISSNLGAAPDVLLVFHFDRSNGFEEVYNGPFPKDLCLQLTPNKRQTVQLALSKLRERCPRERSLVSVHDRSLADLNRLFPKWRSHQL